MVFIVPFNFIEDVFGNNSGRVAIIFTISFFIVDGLIDVKGGTVGLVCALQF